MTVSRTTFVLRNRLNLINFILCAQVRWCHNIIGFVRRGGGVFSWVGGMYFTWVYLAGWVECISHVGPAASGHIYAVTTQ